MFEFAIAQHRKRTPSRLFWVSAAVSVTAHAAVLIILLENPWLLGPGLSHWLERIHLALRTAPKNAPPTDEEWRMVTLAGDPSRMRAPSAAQLKSLMPDWDKAGKSGRMPPIQVRWKDGKAPEIETAVKIPKPVPGPKESTSPQPPAAQVPTTTTAAQGDSPSEASGGTRLTIPLPAPAAEPRPAPPKVAEVSPNAAPKTIPNSIKVEPPPSTASAPPLPASPKSQGQVFQDEKQALKSEGSGLFDTKGFPLGDYASAIIERVKTNWSIPSNLRSSQGRTTVVFYIGKDGRYTDAHIVASSGSRSLDIAALNAVLISSPFPPLPRGFPGDQVGAKFVFSYNERQ